MCCFISWCLLWRIGRFLLSLLSVEVPSCFMCCLPFGWRWQVVRSWLLLVELCLVYLKVFSRLLGWLVVVFLFSTASDSIARLCLLLVVFSVCITACSLAIALSITLCLSQGMMSSLVYVSITDLKDGLTVTMTLWDTQGVLVERCCQ